MLYMYKRRSNLPNGVPQILNVVAVTQQVNELSEDVFLVAEAPLEIREVASEKAITCPNLVT